MPDTTASGGIANTSALNAAYMVPEESEAKFGDPHVITAPATWELTGRILFGLPTDGGMV